MCKFPLVCRVMHFLMVSNQREHFSYSLFYFGCKYKEGEAFKVFKSPYLKGFLGPSSCLSLSTVVDSHLLCSMRQKSFSYNFLLQKFVSPKNGNQQQLAEHKDSFSGTNRLEKKFNFYEVGSIKVVVTFYLRLRYEFQPFLAKKNRSLTS